LRLLLLWWEDCSFTLLLRLDDVLDDELNFCGCWITLNLGQEFICDFWVLRLHNFKYLHLHQRRNNRVLLLLYRICLRNIWICDCSLRHALHCWLQARLLRLELSLWLLKACVRLLIQIVGQTWIRSGIIEVFVALSDRHEDLAAFVSELGSFESQPIQIIYV
jgi:hypothetical protein